MVRYKTPKIMLAPTQVAVGVAFNAEGKILVALRPAHKRLGGFWEFPGGKIEANEDSEQAIKRELLEEVGIEVIRATQLCQCTHAYSEQQVRLDVWLIEEFTGNPHGREGQEIAWVTLEELRSLPVLAANHLILQALATHALIPVANGQK